MNSSKMITTEYNSGRDILTFVRPFAALSVIVAGTGVPADPDVNGQFKIYAGQALQAPAGMPWTDRQTALTLCTGAPDSGNEIVGVTQHDIIFDAVTDEENANCIIFGFVDPQKMDPAVAAIPAEVRAALDGKVWFIDGDRLRA